jgi:hypothetical protein
VLEKTLSNLTLPLQVVKELHTYHSRFIPEEVADASQIFFRDGRLGIISEV